MENYGTKEEEDDECGCTGIAGLIGISSIQVSHHNAEEDGEGKPEFSQKKAHH